MKRQIAGRPPPDSVLALEPLAWNQGVTVSDSAGCSEVADKTAKVGAREGAEGMELLRQIRREET